MINSAVKWVSSYLSGRMQCTAFASATSSVKSIDCGVPQGSTLGPLLFIIYLNDLPQVLVNSCISLYADDTAIYYQANDANEIQVMLQEDLVLIQNWMKINKLSLNVSKTKSMLFNYFRGVSPVLSLSLEGSDIEHVTTYKYRGPLCWNSIPADVCDSATIIVFKNAYLEWFISELDRI